jgi:hypothetical protein
MYNTAVALWLPVKTPKGAFHVWTKRVGNKPNIKVLLLRGGPKAGTWMPAASSQAPCAFS